MSFDDPDEKGEGGQDEIPTADDVDLLDIGLDRIAGPGQENATRSLQAGEGKKRSKASQELDQLPWFPATVVEVSDTPPPPLPRHDPGAVTRVWLEDQGEIARGGMSAIHSVLHRDLRHVVAMKVLDPNFGRDRASRLRFVEEAQITGQLDHPNIPPVHDLWTDEQGNLCFTMKLVKGKTLNQVLAERGPGQPSDRELERLLQLFLKVCDAVSFAHSRGVIHRDIKAENIMVGTHGQVWVMDWGCALLRTAGTDDPVSVARDPGVHSLDPPNSAMGTPGYMAPEQAHGRLDLIDERTDVYLLGGVLYKMLTNRPPHAAPSMVERVRQARRGEVEDPQELMGRVRLPPELCRIAMRALEADPSRRHASVDELREEVEQSLRKGWWFSTLIFPAGILVVEEGAPGDEAYIITSGSCEAFRVESGERVVLRRMGPGDAFGETSIFTDEPRSASVMAVEETTAIVVTRETIERAMGHDSWLGVFVRVLAERFRELDQRLAELRRDRA